MTPQSEDEDRATIAELEVYGVSVKVINALEVAFGYIYVDDLRGVTKEYLLANKRRHDALGADGIAELRAALRRFVDGDPIKTPEECVAFKHGRRGKRGKVRR